MNPLRLDEVDQQAHTLVRQLANGCQHENLGSATVAIYDTAWMSMISKSDGGQKIWLFPESFQFLLNNQLPNGGWQCHATRDDGLLNTLAALLAIRRHMSDSRLDMRHRPNLVDLEARASKAAMYLSESLQDWDVDESLHVGFEILIPALLSMLESEKIYFTFPGRHRLEVLNARKLANFDPEALYQTPTTFLHSLEAFIDRIQFDKLSRQKTGGSMMASPASTAAYLMHTSIWDGEAELYLRKVLHEGSGKSIGGVPSVFPMPIFEISWVLSTLLQSGFSSGALGEDSLTTLVAYLESHLHQQCGLLGFTPSVLADADDTAKALLTLNLLGKDVKPDQMIDHFSTKNGQFLTYPAETHASFSANCNVLITLIHMPNVKDYGASILSIASFLSESWWSGSTRDKWNKSLQYSMMLLAQALTHLLKVWDKGLLKTLPEVLIRDRIPVVLIQILNRTLLAQTEDGVWGPKGYPEITAYGILTLKALSSLPWHMSLQDATVSGIRSGQQALSQSQDGWTNPSYIWVEKVTYGSARLSEAYCLAAMKPSRTTYTWSDCVKSLVDVPEKPLLKLLQLFSNLEAFQSEPQWKMVGSALEGYTFLSPLKAAGNSYLPEQIGAKNEYLAYIPFTWILINNHRRLFLNADLLWDMMVLTVCNFRVDEYMESTVGKLSDANLEHVKTMVHHLCSAQFEVAVNGHGMNGNYADSYVTDGSTGGAHENYAISAMTSVRVVLSHYTQAMLNYPRITGASTSDHSNFRHALCTFLLSHITQIAENSSFGTQSFRNASPTSVFANPGRTFYNWVHTTGAESVSCPFSFAFLTCLLSAASAPTQMNFQKQEEDCFGSARQNYYAYELCVHLAVMSRLYNDFGSVERDRIEANINSINFPEFHKYAKDESSDTEKTAAEHQRRLKGDLLELAKHERRSADTAAERLFEELEGNGGKGGGTRKQREKANALRLFVGVTNLYADLYVARDLSNRIAT